MTLKIAAVSNEMTVADEAPLLQAENGDASATMNQKQISEVPNPGNDLTYIVQTTPGVVMNTDQGGGTFSILGMPSTTYLYTIDGMNNPVSGALTPMEFAAAAASFYRDGVGQGTSNVGPASCPYIAKKANWVSR